MKNGNTQNSHTCWWKCNLTHHFGKLLASIYPKRINAHPICQQFYSNIYNPQNALLCSSKDCTRMFIAALFQITQN